MPEPPWEHFKSHQFLVYENFAMIHTCIHSMDTQLAELISSVPYYKVKTERLCLKEDRVGEDTTYSGK